MKKAILLFLLLPMIANAQYFDVFDIDTSEYPIMKAKFYSIDANGKQILNHSPADFEITENGEPRDVISVSCPEQKEEPFSVVIAIDISGSMGGERIQNARVAIKSFIDLLPDNGSEIALIAFNSKNNYVSDFSMNKEKLKSSVENLSAGGGTDFDAAFLNPMAGALLAINKAKNKTRSIVLITDGYASGNETEIINNANILNTRIYSLTIGATAPQILSNISKGTNGKTYENIITENGFNEAFLNFRNDILIDPCDISWKSNLTCENSIKISIKNKKNGLTNAFNNRISDYQRIRIESNPYFINFGNLSKGESKDTIIKITAFNNTININKVIFESEKGYFEVLNPLPLLISKNETLNLSIRYYAVDTMKQYCKLTLITDYCDLSIGLLAGSKTGQISQRTLELTHPNGGEIFNAGIDTIINWKGVSDKEKVKLNFSSNNGRNWSLLSDLASSLLYNWNIPSINSDSCLIEISQFSTNQSEGEINWWKNYGGSGGETGYLMKATRDGGIIIAGTTSSSDGDLVGQVLGGKSDALIMKINSDGKLEWKKTFGYFDEDNFNSIVELKDGGFIATGFISKNNPASKVKKYYLVVKLNNEGETEWIKEYGGSENDEAESITETSDNSYIVAGWSGSIDGDLLALEKHGGADIWILKLNSQGEIVWSKTFGGNNFEHVISLVETEDNNYLVVAESRSIDGDLLAPQNKGLTDIWLIKLNNLGEIISSKTFGGSNDDFVRTIIPTIDDGFIITGYSRSSDGDFTKLDTNGFFAWTLKLNRFGDFEWINPINDHLLHSVYDIISTSDGGYLLSGSFESYKGTNNIHHYDILLFKLNVTGEVVWSKMFWGIKYDGLFSVVEDSEGGYITVGYSISSNGDFLNANNNGDSDALIIKLNNNGSLEWLKKYGSSSQDSFHKIIKIIDGSYFITGVSSKNDGDITDNKGYSDIWIVKLAGPPQTLQSDTSDAVFSIIMPEPVIQNNDIDLGQMIVGSTKDTVVSSIICNVGDAPLHVLGVDVSGVNGGDFLIPRGAGDFYLKKGECQNMMFEFTPSALGNRSAVATIRTTVGDFQDTIHIRGIGINPVIEATAEIVDFGVFELGQGKDTTVVLVKNVGSTDITITDTRISGPDMEQFTLSTSPVNYTIAAGEEKEFQLNYTAKYGGKSNSFLDFHYDGIGSPIRSLLFAEGIGGEVYPVVADAYVGETVDMGIFLGKIKPEGLSEVATNYSATVSYNSTLLAPIDKSMLVTTEDNKSFITIAGKLSSVSQIAAIPMKVGLGTADRSGLVITEFQLYNANGDSVDYDIEPGVGEFKVLGICEEGGKRLVNPNGEEVAMQVIPEINSGNARIQLTLIETGQTELEIYDQIGNRIETIYSGTPSAGSQEINLDLSKYANGRYYIKLTTPTITKTEIIEVVR